LSLWKAILKPVSTTGKNIPTKPKRKDDCNEELKRYAELIKRTGGVAVDLSHKPLSFPDSVLETGVYANHNEEEEVVGKYWEKIVYYYTKVPEDVACRALEIIKDGRPDTVDMENYEIRFDRKEWHNQRYPENRENSISNIEVIIRKKERNRQSTNTAHNTLSKIVVHLGHRLQLQKVFGDGVRRGFLDDMDWVRY